MPGSRYSTAARAEILSKSRSSDNLPAGDPRGRWLYGALAGISAVGYGAATLVVRSDKTTSDFLRFFGIFFLLSCVWGLSLWLGSRIEPGRRLILAGAVLFRLLLLPAGISFDTFQYQRELLYDGDVWRYLWEGHAWRAGVNPMRTAPSELEEYELEQRDPSLQKRLYNGRQWSNIYANIGYRQVASPYPYTAQAVFRAADWIAPGSVLAFKLIILVFDLGALWLVGGLAGRGARASLVLLVYAWNPLVIKEFAGSAHIDAVLVCLMLAALTLLGTRGSLLLGAAAMVKPAVLLFTPAFYKRAGWKGLLGPLVAAGLMAFAPSEGMRAYAAGWTFNPTLFRILPGNRWTALGIGAGFLCALMVWWFRKDDGSREALYRQGLWLIGAFLLLTPMFAPWYLTWLLPLAALQLSWFWLALSGSIFLAYHAYLNFSEIPALAVLEFAMPLLVWIWISRGQHSPVQEVPDNLRATASSDRKTIFKFSSIVRLVGGLCCVGVAGASSAAAVGNFLYGDYKWIFRLLGLALMAGSLVRYFRQHGVCTIGQAKRRRNWLINVSLLALAGSTTIYVFWT